MRAHFIHITDAHLDDGTIRQGVAWQLIVRMRRFGSDLALNRENGGCWILKLTASVNKLSACALGRSGLLRRL